MLSLWIPLHELLYCIDLAKIDCTCKNHPRWTSVSDPSTGSKVCMQDRFFQFLKESTCTFPPSARLHFGVNTFIRERDLKFTLLISCRKQVYQRPETALFNHKCKTCVLSAAETLVTNSTWEIPIEFRSFRLIPVPARQSPPLVITQHGVCERMLWGHSRTLGAQYSHLKLLYMPPVIFLMTSIKDTNESEILITKCV